MHTHRHPRRRVRRQGQFGDQDRMLGLATHRRTIFAIQGHIHHANTKLLVQLRLQLQAFAHACLDPAVVVAHRQRPCISLRS